MLIMIESKPKRLWAWDFRTRETVSWTTKTILELSGNTMKIKKRNTYEQSA